MGDLLRARVGRSRPFEHPGEEAAVALTVATGALARVFQQVMDEHGVTHTRYNLLRILEGAPREGLAHGELGRKLLVPHPDVTRLLDRLVDRGLVSRRRSAEDRRVVLHTITSDGCALLRAMAPDFEIIHDALVEVLGRKGARSLAGLCESVVEGVAEGWIAKADP